MYKTILMSVFCLQLLASNPTSRPEDVPSDQSSVSIQQPFAGNDADEDREFESALIDFRKSSRDEVVFDANGKVVHHINDFPYHMFIDFLNYLDFPYPVGISRLFYACITGELPHNRSLGPKLCTKRRGIVAGRDIVYELRSKRFTVVKQGTLHSIDHTLNVINISKNFGRFRKYPDPNVFPTWVWHNLIFSVEDISMDELSLINGTNIKSISVKCDAFQQYDNTIQPDRIINIQKNKSIIALNLSNISFSDKGLSQLFIRFECLEYLNLSGSTITGERITILSDYNFPNLRHIFLSRLEINSDTVRVIATGNFPRLEFLHLAHNRLRDAGAQILANSNFPGPVPAECKLTSLTNIDISYNEVGNAGLIGIANGNLRNLKYLNISNNSEITHVGIAVLGNENFKFLNELILDFITLGFDECKMLAQCKITMIKKLSLMRCGLNDDTLLLIFSLGNFNSLVDLKISFNKFTDQGIMKFSKTNLTLLESLDLFHSCTYQTGVKQISVADLRNGNLKSLKNVKYW